MKYTCESCIYETDRKSNYDKHNNSKKHQIIASSYTNRKVSKEPNIIKTSKTINLHQNPTKLVEVGSNSHQIPTKLVEIASSDKNLIINDDDSNDSTRSNDTNITKNNENICNFCQISFTRKDALVRHLAHRCQKKKYSDDIEKEQLKKENEMLKKEVILKENEMLKKEVEYLKAVNEDTTIIAKATAHASKNTAQAARESMSALNYIITKFKDAPAVTPIDDNKLLTYFDNIENDNELIEEFIYNKRHKILDRYIGDVLIKIYKKDNPAEQSIWNSDTQRLNYIIRKLIDTDPSWVIDKKGIVLDKSIIKPPLKNIKNIINKYIINNSTPEKTQFYVENDSYNRVAKQLEILTSIVIEIDDGSLGDNIIKYIAPHFYLNSQQMTINHAG